MSRLAWKRSTMLPLCLATAVHGVAHSAPAPTDSAAVVAKVEEYHEGLRRNAPDRARPGGVAGPVRERVRPHENTVRVVRLPLRRDAALVVTEETGRNRFRQWEGELVTYLLGREGDRWRIVGYFIRDIANPT